MELELRKSTEIVSAIRENILYLKLRLVIITLISILVVYNLQKKKRFRILRVLLWCREAHMREVNEKTNERVAKLSFMSIGVSFIVSLLQVWHLKRFFLKKKLI